jgi:hypothetical protein
METKDLKGLVIWSVGLLFVVGVRRFGTVIRLSQIKTIIPLQAKRPILRKNIGTNFVLK